MQMGDVTRADREFLRAALSLAAKADVDHLLCVSDHPFSPQEMRGRPIKKKLIYGVTDDNLVKQLSAAKYRCVRVPHYDYTRVEKMKVALVAAVSAGLLKDGDTVLCLTGRSDGLVMDTLIKIVIGSGFEDDQVDLSAVQMHEGFNSQVIEAIIQIALSVGQEGFEGHAIGTIIVIGDSTAVMEKSRQLTLNPFQGISEAERNVLDPTIRDAIKNFSVLDGAFVIREDGVVLAAGRYLQATHEDIKIPLGLGSRHASSAAMTKDTRCIAVTVSQTSGSVRVFQNGEIKLELHQRFRRTS
jgi:DNA integrity scanning protein DisA with diadenylate cyclase activity